MMLQEKIMDCIVENGYLKSEALGLTPSQFLEFCNLNENQFTEDNKFIFKLTIYNSTNKINLSIRQGKISYYEDCNALAGISGKQIPYCIQSKESVNFFDKKDAKKEDWIIEILTASNNFGYKDSITGGNRD